MDTLMPLNLKQLCTNPSCFFCIMKEPYSLTRRDTMEEYIKGIPYLEDQELILVVSGLWHVAMNRPNDEELPFLGIFDCLSGLLYKAIGDRAWLLSNQNMYIPYYAAHIIGSYTMNREDFAVRAVGSGVIPFLLELLRGKMSWVEQRVAVRALGHLASYEATFEAVAVYEEEVVKLAKDLASTCLEDVYRMFVGVEDRWKKHTLSYQSDLLTRGVGGVEMENRKAEEWASQLQLWSIHLLNCFAAKERGLDLICSQEFLKDLSEMWGGLTNHASPAGVGLIRNLCYTKVGRLNLSNSHPAIENLCKLSRSSDDWQYMGIDCLLLLLKDPNTRHNIIEAATPYLVDLIELGNLRNRPNVGELITRALVFDYYKHRKCSVVKNVDVERALEEIWKSKIERRQMEKVISVDKLEGKRVIAKLLKQEGNQKLFMGEIKEALMKYNEALEICPLRYRNERVILHSKRAQCHLLLRNLDAAISAATRGLCLSSPPNAHAASLWIRSQAYDMKGMAKESLMDCVMFISVCIKSKAADRIKLPYYAVQMINKQMDSTWLFRKAQLKAVKYRPEVPKVSDDNCKRISTRLQSRIVETMRLQVQNKSHKSGN